MPRLEASGLPSSKAEALAGTIHETMEASVTTTTDLDLMEGRLRLEISEVKTAIEKSANAVTFRILGLLIPVIIAAGVVQHFWK